MEIVWIGIQTQTCPRTHVAFGVGLCNANLGKAGLRNRGGLPVLRVPVGNSWDKCRSPWTAENCAFAHNFAKFGILCR